MERVMPSEEWTSGEWCKAMQEGFAGGPVSSTMHPHRGTEGDALRHQFPGATACETFQTDGLRQVLRPVARASSAEMATRVVR
jgi:hypothetical protein